MSTVFEEYVCIVFYLFILTKAILAKWPLEPLIIGSTINVKLTELRKELNRSLKKH